MPVLGSPTSWRRFVVAVLPHNGCYERHADDQICKILSSCLSLGEEGGENNPGTTPRGKSVFRVVSSSDPKELAKRIADDSKAGLANKKEAYKQEEKAKAERAKQAEIRAAEEKKRAAEMLKKTKHMSRAQREKALKASQDMQAQMLLEGSDGDHDLERDPSGVEGALANINAEDSPMRGSSKSSSSDGSIAGSSSSVISDVTEAEGAADVIYVLSLSDVLQEFANANEGADAANISMTSKPDAVVAALNTLLRADKTMLNAVLEIKSHRPVRAGWVSPSKPISDMQNGVGAAENDSTLSELWSDVALLQVSSDVPSSFRHRPLDQVVSSISRRLADAAVDRYLYDEWLSAATVVKSFPCTPEHTAMANEARLHYDELSSQFPCEAAASILTICDCIVEATVRAATLVDKTDLEVVRKAEDIMKENETNTTKEGGEDNPGEKTAKLPEYSLLGMWARIDRAAIAEHAGRQALKSTGTESENPEDSGPSVNEGLLRVVRYGDKARARLESFDIGSAFVGGRTLEQIITHLVDDCLRVPGGRGRAGMPRRPTKSASERGAELNELLTFVNIKQSKDGIGSASNESSDDNSSQNKTSVTRSGLLHTRTINQFEKLLESADPGGTTIWKENHSLHHRQFRELLDPMTLPQVLAEAMLDAEQTLTQYDTDTDRLLVATHTRTWHRRRNTSKFSTSDPTTGYCSVPPGFSRWRSARDKRLNAKIEQQKAELQKLRDLHRVGELEGGAEQLAKLERQLAAKATRSADLAAPVLFEMGPDEAGAVEDKITTLFPADKAVVRVYSMGGASSSKKSKKKGTNPHYEWASVYKDGHVFGLRPRLESNIVHHGIPWALGTSPYQISSDREAYALEEQRKSLESVPQVFAVGFKDGSRCMVESGPTAPLKPDGHGTIIMTYTDECSGLVVEACTDGSTRMRVVGICGVKGSVAHEEVSRVVTSSGHVVRFLVSGGAEILMTNGNVIRWDLGSQEDADDISQASSRSKRTDSDNEARKTLPGWVVTRNDGTRTRMVPRPNPRKEDTSKGDTTTPQSNAEMYRFLIEEPAVPVKMATDTLVLSRIETRADGTKIITEPDGTRRVEHYEGTVILVQSGGDPDDRSNEEDWGYVTVSAPGFATIELDVDVALNAETHANGGRIALTKGGLQKRNASTMPDGSVLEVSYNTKFTATVNGTVKLIKPDGVELQAYDDLTVEMRCGDLQAAIAAAKAEADKSTVISEGRSEKDLTSGAYFADIQKGHLWSADPEHNELELCLPIPEIVMKSQTSKKKKITSTKISGEVNEDASQSGALSNFQSESDEEPESSSVDSSSDDESDENSSMQKENIYSPIKFSLAGESVEGVHAPASINEPIEPRLFVLSGDGYGFELLRPQDLAEYYRAMKVAQSRVESKSRSHNSIYSGPVSIPRIEIVAVDEVGENIAKQKRKRRARKSRSGRRRNKNLTTDTHDETREASPDSSSSPANLGDYSSTLSKSAAQPMVHVISCNLTERRKCLPTAGALDRGPEPDVPLTLKPKSDPILGSKTAILVRKITEVPAQDETAISAVAAAEANCDIWRDDRDSNQDRFDVDDPRSRSAIDAEKNIIDTIRSIRQRQFESKIDSQKSNDKPPSRNSLRRSRKAAPNNSLQNSSISEKTNDEMAENAAEIEGKDAFVGNEMRTDTGFEEQPESLLNHEPEMDIVGEREAYVPREDVGENGSGVISMSQDDSAILQMPSRRYGSVEDATAAGELHGIPAEERAMHGVGGFWKDEAGQQLWDGNDPKDSASHTPIASEHTTSSQQIAPKLAPIAGGTNQTSTTAVGSARNVIRDLQRKQKSVSNGSEVKQFNSTTGTPGEGRFLNSRGTGGGTGFSRTFNTMSSTEKWEAQQRRGGPSALTYDVNPSQINIGDLCEGAVYRTSLVLRNLSQTNGRFRIGRRGKASEDPEDEGLCEPGCDSKSHQVRVIYRPGPLAPGIKRTLEIEIAAKTPAPVGSSSTEIEDFVEIFGSNQILRVPLRGRIVAAAKHDQRRVGEKMQLVSKS